MSISTISSTLSSVGVSSISSATPQQQPAAVDQDGAVGGVNVDISKPGQLMSELGSLAQSDPGKFKDVTADIAKQLKSAASSQSGSQADFLNKLADRFSAASQSGDVSDLTPKAGKPRGGHQHGGHHGMHAAEAGGGAPGGGAGPGGGGGVGQLVQGIISSSLDGTST